MTEAILIRRVEETLLELFSEGKLNGTIHTCIGQEFSAVSFAGQLDKGDFIFSNHRCHGHFISFTQNFSGLIAEIMGKEMGVCGGIGSSQHLCKENFYSNGIQGGIVPVAAGMALSHKLKGTDAIGIVFIGDGTLGQGVVYESLNILSKWRIPLLIVCENNRYAQSTEQLINLAGTIPDRAKAFGIQTRQSSTWDVSTLLNDARMSIDFVRTSREPLFHLVDTYRLAPHSKGDDHRNQNEITEYKNKDVINLFQKANPQTYREIVDEVDRKIIAAIKDIEKDTELPFDKYHEGSGEGMPIEWGPVESVNARQVDLINQFFDMVLSRDKSAFIIGEDLLSPYGGAFKVMKNLSDRYPQQVLTSPISEQAITGIANGLALGGIKPYVEIMFGDFITLAFDQILNHSSKFYHMYNKQVTCPIVIRTPMGGGRGYGPTHSQTLDKFLVGIDNVKTIALNTLINPVMIYELVHKEVHPVIVIENKSDYGRKIAEKRLDNYLYEKTIHGYPLVRIIPKQSKPTATLVTYGGAVGCTIDAVIDLFTEVDVKSEIIVLTQIHPLAEEAIAVIMDSVEATGVLLTIEEGSYFAGLGSEIIATVRERTTKNFKARRITSFPVPIASAKSLEDMIVVGSRRIVEVAKECLR